MNLIVAIFIYLGLANTTNAVITEQDIANHQTEIQRTAADPGFHQFYEQVCESDGIFVIDIEER